MDVLDEHKLPLVNPESEAEEAFREPEVESGGKH
jgi:hypothetical protein